MENKEKKEKKETSDLTKVMRTGLIMFVITAVVLIVMVAVCVCTRDKSVGRDGYAVISLDGYTDTIYFTERYFDNGFYTFISHDGREVRCHKDNVVIYYDEDEE